MDASFPSTVSHEVGMKKVSTSIADSWIAAWNSQDAEKVVAIFTTDVLFEDVALGAVSHGSAELRKFAASVFEASAEGAPEFSDLFGR